MLLFLASLLTNSAGGEQRRRFFFVSVRVAHSYIYPFSLGTRDDLLLVSSGSMETHKFQFQFPLKTRSSLDRNLALVETRPEFVSGFSVDCLLSTISR